LFHDDYPEWTIGSVSKETEELANQYVLDMGQRLAEQIDKSALKEFSNER
jgi:hypothetical protein